MYESCDSDEFGEEIGNNREPPSVSSIVKYLLLSSRIW